MKRLERNNAASAPVPIIGRPFAYRDTDAASSVAVTCDRGAHFRVRAQRERLEYAEDILDETAWCMSASEAEYPHELEQGGEPDSLIVFKLEVGQSAAMYGPNGSGPDISGPYTVDELRSFFVGVAALRKQMQDAGYAV